MPVVTVAMATLNSGKHVASAIQSIRPASGHLDVELVVADGGSADDTLQRVEEAARASQLPVTVVPGPDRGIYDGMNRAIERARGSFTLILNSDDQLPPAAIDKLVAAAQDVDVVTGSAVIQSATGAGRTITGSSYPMTPRSVVFGIAAMNARLYRTKLLQGLAGPFRIDLSLGADREFLLRVARTTAWRSAVPDVVYSYFGHSGSQTIGEAPAARVRVHEANRRLASKMLLESTTDQEVRMALLRLRGASLMKLAILSSARRLPKDYPMNTLELVLGAMRTPSATIGSIGDLLAWRGRGSGW